ncbi:phenylalanine--tRNA ligase subunit beta [Aureliella helgolandensis]|uniref:Phenylalanine--tRNA ligase beta subunit n=1 Tax=Aureliella helgolandensis TaxID=2527968 RepID=A0A518GAN8_9BACT|nr:phenylalanine--tRNA ligase subunit beta [Aureliella helgolandensis]QDV25629.1 Phenylalanine--tRNA ligase beta subunit [Aureliella helgolandensis]
MLVCWEWLSQYVELSVSPEDLANRYAMSGLNHESTEAVADDIVLDLEVTSNRGDCLGHIGVAREASVLLGKPLRIPAANVSTGGTPVESLIKIVNEFPDACPRYTARVVRGVKIGPSPDWLVRRLSAIGIASVNNVVDATNYVMMECGQPLHAFDLKCVRGGRIHVRPASEKESFVAIDHRTYELDSAMVVIADAERALALGGVMGGVDSEVSASTVDVLIEAATFNPLTIRRAARFLKLHSPSSFRFERRPDPAGLDWASRRCCELILQIAGGELLDGCASAGSEPPAADVIPFRLRQIPRVLGIEIPADEVLSILVSLGCLVTEQSSETLKVTPPTWRGDLTREVDLLEEVARIYGYEKIPEDAAVPMSVAPRRPKDIAMGRVRSILSAYGIDEAMTPSVVTKSAEKHGSVWTELPPLSTETPLLIGAKLLRRSLLPSLLTARHTNQTQSIRNAQLYEVGTIYLPGATAAELPQEQSTLGIVTTGDLRFVRGIVEDIICQVVSRQSQVAWKLVEHPSFQAATLLQVSLNEQVLGFVGLISANTQNAFSLDQPVAAAELSVDVLSAALEEVRQADPVSAYPAVTRDLNFVVDEELTWAALSATCHEHAGDLLQDICYQETYRDTKKDGAGKKRLLLSLVFRSLDRTLTSQEVDAAVQKVIAACSQKFSATLLA